MVVVGIGIGERGVSRATRGFGSPMPHSMRRLTAIEHRPILRRKPQVHAPHGAQVHGGGRRDKLAGSLWRRRQRHRHQTGRRANHGCRRANHRAIRRWRDTDNRQLWCTASRHGRQRRRVTDGRRQGAASPTAASSVPTKDPAAKQGGTLTLGYNVQQLSNSISE